MSFPVSDNRPEVYIEDDGTIVYRASSLGHCLRGLVAARHGVTPYEKDWGGGNDGPDPMSEGELHEIDVVERMLPARGWTVTDRQKEIELVVREAGPGFPKIVVRCHLDGVAQREGDVRRVLEVKSMSKAAYKRWSAKKFDEYPGYAWQVSACAHAMWMPILYVVKCRDDGSLDVWEMDTIPIKRDVVLGRVLWVEKWVKHGDDLPPCEAWQSQWICNYPQLHEGYDEERDPPAYVEDVILDDLAKAFQQARQDVNLAEAKLSEIQKEIKDNLRRRELLSASTETHAFEIKEVIQKRPTMKRIRKLLGKRWEEALEPNTAEYLNIKEIKE